ncbi:MAG: DUF1631 domain-containing protein [Pseudomonadales bacterium]
MTQSKVVPLKREGNRTQALPPIVNSIRQQARKQLLVLLRDLLDSTDDALFEMADRSHNDADHHLYFDSMRQIRLHRSDIQTLFVEDLNAGFESVFHPRPEACVDQPELVADDADAMSLLNNDELEVSVAISGIVSKVTSQFSLPIMELTRRFDHLAKHGTVNERRNPLGPQAISECFAAAIGGLEIDIRIRIILLKLFERHVMQKMGPIYDEANRLLADAGVLKDLKRTLARGRNPHDGQSRSAADSRPGQGPTTAPFGSEAAAAGPAGEPHSRAQPGASGGPFDFGAIQSLLAGARNDSGVSGGQLGPIIATPALLDLLNAVQVESGKQALTIDQVPPLLDLRQVVVSRAPDVTGEAMNQLGRADEDVVNFIGLLFDYILNDRNLAIPMKALIARLQIPIVKLAIIDKSFFERSSHPARELLNELSSAGIGWSSAAELKRDAVYDKIESVVVRVLNGFSDNPGIFKQLLDELRSFRTQDSERQGRMEQRIREKESGRARTLAAKQEAQQVINQKACGMRLPRELGRFLSEVWSRALVFVSLREGAGSAEWASLVATLDELLWSLQPLDDLNQIEQRDALRDDLLDRLGEAMTLIQVADTERSQWLTVIRDQLCEVSSNDRAYLEDDALPVVAEHFTELEEIVLAAPQEVTDSYQGPPAEPAFVDKINRLTEGTWVELKQDAGTVVRCKLATIVRPGDRYVFINRRGMKVAEKTRMELARELQDERMLVLNDAQVFDRALQAVIGNLRQIQNGAPSR